MPARPPVWLWINLLSLDGPLVALIWQDFVSRCYPSVLLPQGRWALGLTVWAIYIADRLLDVRGPARAGESPNHRFYREHRRTACVALGAILAADLLITILWVSPEVRIHGFLVGTAALVYLCAFTGGGIERMFWKKACAAILFTAGVFLVALTWINRPAALLWAAVAFAILCKANLTLIGHWAREGETRQWGTQRVWIGLLLFAIVCAAAGQSRWYWAIGLSSGALAALALAGENFSAGARGILADVVLMSPLLLR